MKMAHSATAGSLWNWQDTFDEQVTQETRWERIIVWWADLLWGFWNGLTAWIVLVVHVFGGWEQFPFYNAARSGNWDDLGFLLGAGSPLLGSLGGRGRRSQ
jgi:hypothetical protein